MTGFTERLAQWAAQTPRSWSEQAVDAAERAIVDTVACITAGAADAAVTRVRKGLGNWGEGGRASAVGCNAPIDAPWAALINGTAAHALDYDDVLDPAASHLSAVLVPALLALGEEEGSRGHDLIDAYIVGAEVQQCLAEAVNMTHYTRGWHTTLTLGAPSAAAAAARMLGADREAMVHAISLATSMAAGFKRQFGTNAKPFHAGLAAKSGLLAAKMALAGLTADTAPLEGARGFGDLLAGAGARGFDAAILDRLSATPAVVRPGLWLKRYPCCASTHRAVDAVLDLMRAHDLNADSVASVETRVSAAAVGNLMYRVPVDEMQARFSMHYCVAAAAIDRDLTLETFRASSISRPDILAWLGRVSMVSDPDQPADMPSTTKSWATVVVRTVDGRSFESRVVDPRGYPDRPLSEEELQRKFLDCAQGQADPVLSTYATWRRAGLSESVRALCMSLRAVGAVPHHEARVR
jgi:2-methylcitrate dehydratase PrpD